MHPVRFTSETSSNGVIESCFIVGEVPGVLWSPVSGSDQAPLVLMGHGGGQHKKTPALMARAHDTVTTWGFTVRYATSLANRAIPEWQATLDALQELPEIGAATPIGYGGGISLGTAIGVPLTAIEPRITAAIFGGGFFVYEAQIEAARRITVPVQFLLPWDDEHVDRQSALALFDAFASKEKTLHANPGDHRTVRWTGVDNGFLARHLGRAGTSPA
jgi:dienelactone hydrolase